MNWTEEFVGLLFKGLPSLGAIVPNHIRRQIRARIRDHNPFNSLPGKEHLLRAARWAWIDAALSVLDAAKELRRAPEWANGNTEVAAFDARARQALFNLRDAAFDWRYHLNSSKMDGQLGVVLFGIAEVRDKLEAATATPLSRTFVSVLADLIGWPESEIPASVAFVASVGLPIQRDGPRCSFDEAVFARFAEILNDAKLYPEAREAFRTAMTQFVLNELGEVNEKLQGHVDILDALRDGLEEWRKQSAAIEGRMTELVERFMTQPFESADGTEPLDRNLVIALARRVRSSQEMSLEEALIELTYVVEVYCRTLAGARPGTVSDDPVDSAIARASVLSRSLCFDQAMAELTTVLDAEQRRAEREASINRERRRKLHRALLDQSIMRRDAVAAADQVEALSGTEDCTQTERRGAIASEQSRYFREGSDRHLRLSLEIAVELARRLSSGVDEPITRGAALHRLADALSTLGAREQGPERLNEAIALYREASSLFEEHRRPLLWAATQNALADALFKLGASQRDRKLLDDAVLAHRAALRKFAKGRHPDQWAATQNGLGNVLGAIGDFECAQPPIAVKLFAEAVRAYRAALRVWTRERNERDWAMAQQNLGVALLSLARTDGGTRRLKQAHGALTSAAEFRTQSAMPMAWATTMNNLASVLELWGMRTNNKVRLEAAIETYDMALSELTTDRVPAWHQAIVTSRSRVAVALDALRAR